jgi:hypothetical protein
MIAKVILISLFCTGLHIAFSQGNALSFIRVWVANKLDHLLGKKWSLYVQKPIWGCLPCMASVYGLLLGGFNLLIICAVCGLNVIIDRKIVRDEEAPAILGEAIHGVTEYTDEVPTMSRQSLMHQRV